MPITFDNEKNIFNLSTPNTSYIFGIVENRLLAHIYYGKRIDNTAGMSAELSRGAFSSVNYGFEQAFSTDVILGEYPTYGNTDLRTPAFHAVYENGSRITNFEYVSHTIEDGKPKLQGLPATYTESGDEAQTLTIELADKLTGVKAYLSYTVFNEFDAIAKSVKISNCGTQTVKLLSAMSSGFDISGCDYDVIHLPGKWARERQIERTPLTHGSVCVDSKRCSSSHMHNPFIAVVSKNTTEDFGDAYGFNLVYSGNFIAKAEADHYNNTRVLLGINPFDFGWTLKPTEEFRTPEVVMVYSANGLGDMSRTYHKLYRTRLCRGKYRDIKRPVLINNWEATYFDFNEEKILKIAENAKKLGIELMVLDDGWFGNRNEETCSLGDWYANKEKLPSGISGLANKINDLGMKFGLWFEPEMVSPDSDLYREHPDWCIHANDRARNEGRHQLVLDLSRTDVCDYVKGFLFKMLSEANISYVKWDMNRNITDLGSDMLSSERQSEQAHRYILGLYDIMETVTAQFPDVLFEGCSGGGGRFDAGMLYYMPQIWTSDCSDAIERLRIQEGTSLVYPFSAMGCHVSAVPNHQCNRITPYMTRFNAAMPGQFGYELDLGILSDGEKEMTKLQVKEYTENADFLHNADFYRLISAYDSTLAAWEFVSEDKDKAMLFAYMTLVKANDVPVYVKLKNLNGSELYKCSDGNVYSGDVLMNVGYKVFIKTDFESERVTFTQI